MTDQQAVTHARKTFNETKKMMTRMGIDSEACVATERVIKLAEECLATRERGGEHGLTCIHIAEPMGGLCQKCQADYDGDPSAYIEFGDHPEGIRRWQALQEEIARDAAEGWTTCPLHEQGDIPF